MSPPQQDWYYCPVAEALGPVSANQLKELAASGSLGKETPVWTEVLEDWIPAGQVEGLFEVPEPPPARPQLLTGSHPGSRGTKSPTAVPRHPLTTAGQAPPRQELASARRFGRKSPFARLLCGGLLVTLSLLIQTCNERHASEHFVATRQVGGEVRQVESASIDPANEGMPILLTGVVTTKEVLRNEEFAVEARALRIGWHASIYQWGEDKRKWDEYDGIPDELPSSLTPSHYSYSKFWAPGPIDSSKFKYPKGHSNDSGRPRRFSSGTLKAQEVTLGAFQLPADLVRSANWASRVSLQSLPGNLAGAGHLSGGTFYTADRDHPEIGDEMVEFSVVPPGEATVIAMQKGNTLAPIIAANGNKTMMLVPGSRQLEDMLEIEHKRGSASTWVLRLLGVFFLFCGLTLVTGGAELLTSGVSTISNLLRDAFVRVVLLLCLGVECLTVAAAWWESRPQLAIPHLIAAGAGFLLLVMLGSTARRRSSLEPHGKRSP